MLLIGMFIERIKAKKKKKIFRCCNLICFQMIMYNTLHNKLPITSILLHISDVTFKISFRYDTSFDILLAGV